MWKKWYVLQSPEEGAESGSASGGSASAEGLSEDSSSLNSDVNWDSLDTSFDEPEVEGDLEVIETSSPAQTSTPSEPAAPPTQAAPPAAPAASSSPAATPPEAQVPPASQSAPPPLSQESQSQPNAATPEQYQGWREARLGELEKHYTFSEDESAALLTEPELVLPKLAAKVHMEVLENSMRAMQAMVPIMMEQVQQHTEVQGRAKNLFTSINPDLADPSLEPVILQLGATYRQMNRSAGPEEASRAIGNLVRAALNMQPPQAQQNFQSVPPAPAPVPFAPVRGGGGGNRPVTSSNQFEQLANELLMDEDL